MVPPLQDITSYCCLMPGRAKRQAPTLRTPYAARPSYFRFSAFFSSLRILPSGAARDYRRVIGLHSHPRSIHRIDFCVTEVLAQQAFYRDSLTRVLRKTLFVPAGADPRR